MHQSSYVVEYPQRQHQNNTETQHQKDTEEVIERTNSCALPSFDLHQLPTAVALGFGALMAIYQPKQTKSAICAFTRMCVDQGKQQNQARMTLPTAVHTPLRLPAVGDQVVTTNRVHCCPTDNGMSTRVSKRVRVGEEGRISPDRPRRVTGLC